MPILELSGALNVSSLTVLLPSNLLRIFGNYNLYDRPGRWEACDIDTRDHQVGYAPVVLNTGAPQKRC